METLFTHYYLVNASALFLCGILCCVISIAKGHRLPAQLTSGLRFKLYSYEPSRLPGNYGRMIGTGIKQQRNLARFHKNQVVAKELLLTKGLFLAGLLIIIGSLVWGYYMRYQMQNFI